MMGNRKYGGPGSVNVAKGIWYQPSNASYGVVSQEQIVGWFRSLDDAIECKRALRYAVEKERRAKLRNAKHSAADGEANPDTYNGPTRDEIEWCSKCRWCSGENDRACLYGIYPTNYTRLYLWRSAGHTGRMPYGKDCDQYEPRKIRVGR